MALGLQRGTVTLSPHCEVRHQLSNEEKSRILDAIGELVINIEHVGSTAICRIVAKTTLDVMVGIATFEDGEKRVLPLEKLGYGNKGENGVPGRHFFRKGEPRTHHLHIVAARSDFWKHHLLFRDYLISNRQIAEEYNKLKADLAARFPQDREAYTNGVESFVTRVLREAENSK